MPNTNGGARMIPRTRGPASFYVSHSGFTTRAFTLLEIIIVLAIAAVLMGLCVPYISGMLREEQMRDPVRELQGLAKAMRNRAMTERVPYEITFTATGFLGCKHVQYTDNSDGTTDSPSRTGSSSEGAAPKTSGTAASAPTTTGTAGDSNAPVTEVIAQYDMSPEMTCQILYWGSNRWVDPVVGPGVAAGSDQQQCRWVFQPSGLCNPLRVQFRKGTAWIEVVFNPLTADIQEERYLFPD